ncbi:MAG TPA: hypothetical protein VF857_03800 [Spirochaetota bacterium]
MRRLHIAVIFIILALTTHAAGNMRAPLIVTFMSSSALTKSTGTVLSERLTFDCDAPVTAANSKNETIDLLMRYARITASYTIFVERDEEISTSFILADNLPVTIILNGKNIGTSDSRPISDVPKMKRSWHTLDKSLYESSFKAKLGKGINELTITYRQPMSFSENHYGYFTTSTYITSFSYEMWPLREWTLADNFAVELNVMMSDDTGFTKIFFGSDYAVRISGEQNHKEGEAPVRREITGTAIPSPENMLMRKAMLDKNFPDILFVQTGLKGDLK